MVNILFGLWLLFSQICYLQRSELQKTPGLIKCPTSETLLLFLRNSFNKRTERFTLIWRIFANAVVM